jgi:hypothetical protein
VTEHARQFLTAVLPAVPQGQTAYINIHWSKPANNKDGTPRYKQNGERDKWWDGRACSSVDEAAGTITWIGKTPGQDIYVCMSLQSKCEDKVSHKGAPYKRAMRLADDAISLRSFFIDVDVKEEAYPTTQAALDALKAFIDAVGLPIPTALVASGSGGFHAHWCVERALTPVEWQPLANALAAAVQANGLMADTQCTVDSARILRIPNTLNYKTDPPNPVTLMSLGQHTTVETLDALLAPYKSVLPPKVTTKIEANDELGANLTEGSIEYRAEDVAKQCGFLARTIGTGGKDNAQPLWFLTGSLASFLTDGRNAFHLMSKDHPGYSPKETDELYDRVEATRRRRNLGWPSCAKIAGYGAKECQTCPLLQHGKSPLNFALAAANDVPDGELPDKYVRNKDGLVSVKAVNEDGVITLIPVTHYPIINGWLSNNPWTLHFTTRGETGRRSVVEIPTEVICGKEGFGKYMGGKGFFCTDAQYKIVKEFFVAWLQKLQQSKDSVISAAPFGWSVVDGKVEGFTYAGRVWMDGNDRPAASPNPVLSYQYTPKGNIEPWRDLARIIYDQKRPALDAILAVAFAAPLVRFTGFPGLLLNAYSPESGIGKTTAMKTSQGVWGHPVLAMQGLNDTANSVLGKMGQTRSLPMYWDELKSDQQTKRFVSIVFDLTGGREKTRMNADATLKMSGTWQTMMVSASNDSIIDAMAREVGSTTAGLHRLFEYTVPKPEQVTHDVGAVQRLAGKLEDNYGHAGLAYAKFLGKHHARIEQEVAAMQDAVCREVNVRQEERHWTATIAVLMKGAEFANELGLTQINLEGLHTFLLDVLARMRSEVDASPADMNNNMSISAILAEFFNSTRARNTLITNRIWVAKGKPQKGAIQVLCDASKLGEIIVHIGREDKLIRISSIYLTRWMAERGYSRHTLVKRLESEFGLTKVNGKLGGGTDMTCATEHLLELDGNDPRLAAFVDI